jgi:hypothetical protein
VRATFLRSALATVLCLISGSSFAIYRCDTEGRVSYSDTACPGGKELDIKSSETDNAPDARRQLANDRKILQRAEARQDKVEAAESRARQRAARKRSAADKKCEALERKQRWANEDQKAASAKAVEKARRKASRASERYEAECGKRHPLLLQG